MDVIQSIFFLISLGFILLYRKITIFFLIYWTTFIYFLPIILGQYIYMSFTPTGVYIINEKVNYDTYNIAIFILFSLSLFHILFSYIFKNQLVFSEKIKNKLEKKIFFLSIILLFLQFLLFLKLGNVIFSDNKHEIMVRLGSVYNAKVALQLIFLAILLIVKRYKIWQVFLLFFLFGFDIFIGFRYTLVWGIGIGLIIYFYNNKISLKTLFSALPFVILFFVFFTIYGNIRTELRLLDFQGIIEKMSRIEWWIYSFSHIEPMSIFGILNESINSNINCENFNILTTSFLSSVVPFGIVKYQTFHDCFQPVLFPYFENIASNSWAESYVLGNGLVGVIMFLFFLFFLVYIASYIFEKRGFYLSKIFFIIYIGSILVYFQRSDINYFLFTFKRELMGFLIFLIIYKIRIRFNAN